MMKKILYTLLIAIGLVSCDTEKYLDLAPISAIGDNGFYSNAAEVEEGVIAIYDGLQAVYQREFALTEMRSDNSKTKSSEGDWAQFERLDVRATNRTIGEYWSSNYNVIFRANRILEHLDVVTDATLKAQFEGEARFARALAHFNLVRAFGDVPLIDKVVIQTDTEYFSQTAKSDVLNFIENDLALAATQLPGRTGIEEGRATKGAAQGLLGKVRLTMGDYSGAETVLAALLANTDYALEPNYSDVFYDEMNSEILFAVVYLNDNSLESQDFSFEMTLGGVVSGLNYLTTNFKQFAADSAGAERAAVLASPSNANEVGKFLTTSSNVRFCGNDWIVLRLADVHLMYAEAIMAGAASTSDANAIASYNAVRARAGMWSLSQGALSKEMLLNERRAELAFEDHRFYDIIRFGKADSILGAFATANGYIYSSTDLVLPIPQNEINLSQGALKQNPGY
jgi:hypothetical protein